MAIENIKWLHSGGPFNKEPENDLGNYPSRFEIAGSPLGDDNVMNNLFDDVMPEEVETGLIDYRCFYLWNANVAQAIECITVELSDQCFDCGSDIEYGSKFQNDIQIVDICCEGFESQPDVGGYVIFDTEFGAPFTVYWQGWLQFGEDLQTRLNEIPWCESVTVTGTNPYTVEFANSGGCGVGNRNVRLIRVVQNHLHLLGLCTYNTVAYYGCDSWNGFADVQVKVVQQISNYVPSSGTIRIYNPLTGLWDAYDYNSRDDFHFFLDNPLQFNLVGFRATCQGNALGNSNDTMNWQRDEPSPATDEPMPAPWGVIEAPCQEKTCHVNVFKKQSGSPINAIATPILDDTFEPDVEPIGWSTSLFEVGNLKPSEGFYMWVKRNTTPGAGSCLQDFFEVKLVGTNVSCPK